MNTLTVTVSNVNYYTGLNLCANLEINASSTIFSGFDGPSTFCVGDPLSFNGYLSPGSGPTTHYLWGIQECNSAGVVVPGGFSWELWHLGTPGAFTFPSSLNLPCNKYYRIRMAAVFDNGQCLEWSEPSKVIYYICRPNVNAGTDITICEGAYGFVGTLFPPSGMTYAWRIGNGPVLATTSGMFVNPVASTVYTLTGTNSYGCSASDQVIVNVRPNKPNFNISTNTADNNYYTITAAPVVQNAIGTQPGFGYYWSLEGLDALDSVVFTVSDPVQWHTYPSVNTFRGFDHTSTFYINSVTLTSNSPTNGRFLYNRKYRITRSTWNDNCSQKTVSYIVMVQKVGLGLPEEIIYETVAPEQNRSGAMSAQEPETADNDLRIFPNPTTGQLNISLDTDLDAQVDVFDLFGKKIQSRTIAAGTRTLQIDLSGYAKGMYLIHVTKGSETSTHKVILQ
ncbi:MAG: T9SS type A sorting domain-containing protein [Bacteroidia bacterium]|nr:T9SS type A sorting domain-containing protein [Bacteroidia bacterium]